MSHESLTPAEAERLHLLIEECGEVIQAAAKTLRHGYESYDPTVAISCRETNRQMLEYELGHVYAAIMRMTLNQDLDLVKINESRKIKLERGGKWMHHQPDAKDHLTMPPTYCDKPQPDGWECVHHKGHLGDCYLARSASLSDPRPPYRGEPKPAINLEVTMDPAVAEAIRNGRKGRCQAGGTEWQCTRDEGHEGPCAAIRRER